MIARYTELQVAWLEEAYKHWPVPELTERFNERYGESRTEHGIKTALTRRGLRSGRKTGSPPGTLRLFTLEQADWLRHGYRRMTQRELTVAFNAQFGTTMSESKIRVFLRNHSIPSGRTGRFRKGAKPWNKGISFAARGRAVETQFKPGNRPHTWRPVGSERISKDGYRQRKLTDTGYPPRDWVCVHTLLWEQHHGPVPPRHVVIFLDRDKTNVVIENLACIPRGVLAVMNKRYPDVPAELRRTAIELARLHIATTAASQSR